MAFRPEFVDSGVNPPAGVTAPESAGFRMAPTITYRDALAEISLGGVGGATIGAFGDASARRGRPF